jgi:nucleoside phosphorylase
VLNNNSTHQEIAMQTENGGSKRAFDGIIIVPLEEEFEVVQEQFNVLENLTDDNNVRFVVSVSDCPERYLLVQQAQMGRQASSEATIRCLAQFNTSVLICVGIAGGLSGDVAIGDVCYTAP